MITIDNVKKAVEKIFKISKKEYGIYDFKTKIDVVFNFNQTITLNSLIMLGEELNTEKINILSSELYMFPGIEILKV